MITNTETWYVIQYSLAGADDWYSGQSLDTESAAREYLKESPKGEFEYRIAKKTLTEEVAP